MENLATQLAGIVVTAILTTVGTWVVARYTLVGAAEKEAAARAEVREREARYLAIRLVCVLDPFIYRCCSISMDDGEPDQDGYYVPQVEAPAIVLPDNVDWRCLDQQLMYRALSFPNDIEAAKQSISAALEYAGSPPDYPEYFIQRRKSFAQLGLAAVSLAEDLRAKFDIPLREDGDDDPLAHLNGALSKALSDDLRMSSFWETETESPASSEEQTPRASEDAERHGTGTM